MFVSTSRTRPLSMKRLWPLFAICIIVGPLPAFSAEPTDTTSETVALWLFNERVGIYPSFALADHSETDIPLILGPGGQIVPGNFGNALEPVAQEQISFPKAVVPEGAVRFGLVAPERIAGRTVEPLIWRNANFCALTTQGESHLRKHVQFKNATQTKLNLGLFDWTVEFWFQGTRDTGKEGVVFEIGAGPRGENDHVTRLVLNADRESFSLFNQPSGTNLLIPSNPAALRSAARTWHHLAFVYSARKKQLRHYVDGAPQLLATTCTIEALPVGEEAYFSLGRDSRWDHPLGGRIDELRFSGAAVYDGTFESPGSFDPRADRVPTKLRKGPPLLFRSDAPKEGAVALNGRKHLFIDDALVEEMENINFTPNTPIAAERVVDNLDARKHLTVLEDDEGLIRLYYPASGDRLAIMTSQDGIHFDKPIINPGAPKAEQNIINFDETGVGSVFIDPNAPKHERWKYLSGYDDRGIFVYTSPDGYAFRREKTPVLPFRSGSQSVIYYDDQRQTYASFERSGMATQASGETRRRFVRTETRDLMKPWPFRPVSQQETFAVAKKMSLKPLQPYYLDNGPLTPGGFGLEYPVAFSPRDNLDPVGSNIYVPKAIKYDWSPDAYFGFPTVYFNYQGDGPATQQALGEKSRNRGSGPSEVQLAVSRDGISWKRYPRPTYVGIGRHHGQDDHEIYMVHGVIRRGEEIWQYYFGRTLYHSSWTKGEYDSVFRVVQRFDGFVSADAAYTGGWLKTRPLTFQGNRLVLNIDTDATGYAQVGLLDADGRPIPGYGVDDCIYINGDFMQTEVEWIKKGQDVSALAGKPIRLLFRMRGTKLYSLQFLDAA